MPQVPVADPEFLRGGTNIKGGLTYSLANLAEKKLKMKIVVYVDPSLSEVVYFSIIIVM